MVNGGELRDAMQTTLAPPLVSTRLSRLAADLKALAGCEDDVLEKRGPRNGQEYRLSPLIRFHDARGDLEPLQAKGVLWSAEEIEVFAFTKTIPFETSDQRRLVVASMLSQARHIEDFRGYQGLADARGEHPVLDCEEVESLLIAMEEGLGSFLLNKPDTPTTIALAAEASERLLASCTSFLHSEANFHARPVYGRRYDDLFQEGAAAALHFMAGIKDSVLLADRAKFFYGQCRESVRGSIRRHLREEVQESHGITFAEYSLRRHVLAVEARLMMEMGREPSPSEIFHAIRAAGIECEEEGVERCLLKMGDAPRLDAYETWITGKARAGMVHDPFDIIDERMAEQELVNRVFSCDDLDDREKICLSLYYGAFNKVLCGKEFYLASPGERRVTFRYPDTVDEFNAQAGDAVGVSTRVGKVLSTVNIDRYIASGLTKAKEALDNIE